LELYGHTQVKPATAGLIPLPRAGRLEPLGRRSSERAALFLNLAATWEENPPGANDVSLTGDRLEQKPH
jgi:hypothetical protein